MWGFRFSGLRFEDRIGLDVGPLQSRRRELSLM